MPEIIFNSELWESGLLYNCYVEGCSLCASKGAVYISKSIDSLENKTIWNRMATKLCVIGNSSIKVSYFACDYKVLYHNGGLIDIDGIIDNIAIETQKKIVLLDGLWMGDMDNPKDIPILKAQGRYFWFKVNFETYEPIAVSRCQIYFNTDSLADYLPDFFSSKGSNDDFLHRFLGMFQALYWDLDKDISNISRILNVKTTKLDFLQWISEWVSVDRPTAWQEEILRKFVANMYSLSKIKGTKECLEKAIELYTGQKPFVVETYEMLEYGIEDLFGDDECSFKVIVEQESVSGDRSIDDLKKIVEYYKPIYTNSEIIVLKPFLVLGRHTYLGINTRILDNTELELNDRAMLPFNAMILR